MLDIFLLKKYISSVNFVTILNIGLRRCDNNCWMIGVRHHIAHMREQRHKSTNQKILFWGIEDFDIEIFVFSLM